MSLHLSLYFNLPSTCVPVLGTTTTTTTNNNNNKLLALLASLLQFLHHTDSR
jgi:hypothetical protein